MGMARLRHGALCAALAMVIVVPCAMGAVPVYRIIPIVPSRSDLVPTALNRYGQVTGTLGTGLTGHHAFIYSNGQLWDLGTLATPTRPGDVLNAAINDYGVVVGTAVSPDYNTSLGFIYQNGAMTPLPTAGFNACQAAAINDSGLIVGSCSNLVSSETDAFPEIFENGQAMTIPSLVGRAVAVNDYGQVLIADAHIANLGAAIIYNHDQGSVTYLPRLPTADGTSGPILPYAINNSGQVAGTLVKNPAIEEFSASEDVVLYADGRARDFGAPTDAPAPGAGAAVYNLSLNNAGQMVGYWVSYSPVYFTSGMFLYTGGTRIDDLNALVDPDDPNAGYVHIFAPSAINDDGWIIGLGSDTRTDNGVAVMLAPKTPFPPMVELRASESSVLVPNTLTLSWIDQSVTSCTASGGAPGDGWAGTVSAHGGQLHARPGTNGTYTYTLTCEGAAGSATSQVTVKVQMYPSVAEEPAGGGGAVDWLFVSLLGVLVGCRIPFRRCDLTHRPAVTDHAHPELPKQSRLSVLALARRESNTGET